MKPFHSPAASRWHGVIRYPVRPDTHYSVQNTVN